MPAEIPATDALKIRDLRFHSIVIADPPIRSSYGLHAPYALRTIIELESVEGVVGLSETHGGEAIAAELEGLRARLAGVPAARLLGSLADKTPQPPPTYTSRQIGDWLIGGLAGQKHETSMRMALSALEVAALDLIGKTVGMPVCDLLGGRVRDLVPFSAYAFYKHPGGGGEGSDVREDIYGECLTPETLVGQVKQMIAEYGFESIKLKAGVLDPEVEIETMRQLRVEFGPNMPLRIDPNSAWTVDTSMVVARALVEELSNGGYLEDPTPGIDGMAELRRRMLAEKIDTPLASNVAVTSFRSLAESIPQDAVQIILGDHHYWGGPRAVQGLAKICETFGLGLSMHSNSHLGISLMAMAHLASATPHLTYACDTHYPWQFAEDEVVVGGRIPFEGGCVRVTDAPGLGVTLDLDAVARGRERYAGCEYRKRDDELEMRKHIDANWTRSIPRW